MRVSVAAGVLVFLVVSQAQADTGLVAGVGDLLGGSLGVDEEGGHVNLGIMLGIGNLRSNWARVFGTTVRGSFAQFCGEDKTCEDCVYGVTGEQMREAQGLRECLREALMCGNECFSVVGRCARSVPAVNTCLGSSQTEVEVARK